MAGAVHKAYVPRLNLRPGVGSPSTAGKSPTINTAPTRPEEGYHPRCPKCGHGSRVRPWKKWAARGTWIWHCSYPVGGSDVFCSYLFTQEDDYAYCVLCELPLSIEERAGKMGYWCPDCDFFLDKLL